MNNATAITVALGALIALLGLALLVISNRMYYRRTQDPRFSTRFWLSRDVLTRREYVLNRVGFALAYGVLGLVIVAAAVAALVGR